MTDTQLYILIGSQGFVGILATLCIHHLNRLSNERIAKTNNDFQEKLKTQLIDKTDELKLEIQQSLHKESLELQKSIHVETLEFQEREERFKDAKNLVEAITLLERRRKLYDEPSTEFWEETCSIIVKIQAACNIVTLGFKDKTLLGYIDEYNNFLDTWFYHIRNKILPSIQAGETFVYSGVNLRLNNLLYVNGKTVVLALRDLIWHGVIEIDYPLEKIREGHELLLKDMGL